MTSYDRELLQNIIDYIYSQLSDDKYYIEKEKREFINKCCKYDNISFNAWLKQDISKEAIREIASNTFNIYYNRLLMHILENDNLHLSFIKSKSI